MLELGRIGCQSEFIETMTQMVAQALEQGQYPPSHQRLAPRNPYFAYPAPDKGVGDVVEFLQRQQILARQEGHLLCHTICAAQIAPICHREAKVCDLPVEGIGEGGRRHCFVLTNPDAGWKTLEEQTARSKSIVFDLLTLLKNDGTNRLDEHL